MVTWNGLRHLRHLRRSLPAVLIQALALSGRFPMTALRALPRLGGGRTAVALLGGTSLAPGVFTGCGVARWA
ncbi:MAG: hypothetical protein ACRDI2_16140 [Chloroflexota bacterium]